MYNNIFVLNMLFAKMYLIRIHGYLHLSMDEDAFWCLDAVVTTLLRDCISQSNQFPIDEVLPFSR